MSKRTIRYIVVAALLIAGLVVAYFALQEPKPLRAYHQGKPVVQF